MRLHCYNMGALVYCIGFTNSGHYSSRGQTELLRSFHYTPLLFLLLVFSVCGSHSDAFSFFFKLIVFVFLLLLCCQQGNQCLNVFRSEPCSSATWKCCATFRQFCYLHSSNVCCLKTAEMKTEEGVIIL